MNNIETQYEQREFDLPGTSSYQDEAKREIRRDQDNYMPTGLYVKPNEQVTIEVSGSQNIRAIIGTYQYEISGGKQFKISPGSNTISSPNGGVLWFDNYQDTGTVKVKVTQGGNFVPFFELGKHTKTDWIMMLDKYSEAHAVQLKSKKAVLIVSRDSAKKYIVNQDPIPLLKKYDEMIQAQDKISGLSETDTNPLHRSTRRLWTFIENTYSPNWGMYASRDGAVFTTAGEAIKSALDVNDFGWGQFHEAGHARQQYPWIWDDFRGMTEVTVNVYSLAAQKQLFPNQPTRLEIEGDYDRAFAYLKQTNKEYKDIDDLWVKLVMLWQLHLAYGDDFYPNLHKFYRELPDKQLPATDEDKIQAFIYNTSKVAKQNLLPFFDQWGLNATPLTRKNVEDLNLPILIDPIWEATDATPVEVFKDGVYSIQTKMNPNFSIYNDNGLIKMGYALDYPEGKFEVAWNNLRKAYTCTQNGTNLALSIENGQIV
ncbi:TPA: M60 family metallopeptidase, partial [Bacillus cereus]